MGFFKDSDIMAVTKKPSENGGESDEGEKLEDW